MDLRALSQAVIAALTAAIALSGTTPAHAEGDEGARVLELINNQRTAFGCPALTINAQLASSAHRYAADMMYNGAKATPPTHPGTDGSTIDSRIQDSGYKRAADGEIAYDGWGGNGTPEAAVDWWMHSPPHRAVIWNCGFTDAGAATITESGRMVAVADFGTTTPIKPIPTGRPRPVPPKPSPSPTPDVPMWGCVYVVECIDNPALLPQP